MATLDLRNVGQLSIKVLTGKAWNFELTGLSGTPVLTGAAASMVITKRGTVVQTLGIGSGLTITATNKIAIAPASLSENTRHNYTLEITPVSGQVIRIIDVIDVTNE